jgi:hypothetical protein
VIFAEGAPAETFVDCDNRLMFHNAAEFAALYPDAPPAPWQFCGARLEPGDAALTALRERLVARAAALGRLLPLTRDPALRLVADGIAVPPLAVADHVYRFAFDRPPGAVWLASRSAVPADTDPAASDWRRLGVSLRRITVRDAALTLDLAPAHPLLRDGFCDSEGAHRWTGGLARLPATLLALFAGPIEIDIALWPSELHYAGQKARQALSARG